MKKIMVCGASYLQNYMIDTINSVGIYSIALDGNPDCEKTCRANRFLNIDISDKDQVLEIARKEKIDGILTYASDVGAITAAYVGEKLGLPTNPYESVVIMTDKVKMRNALKEHGFNVPESVGCDSIGDAKREVKKMKFPLMVKPADSSGSKGVSKILRIAELENAYNEAVSFSRSGKVIIEEYIERDGYQIDMDCLMVDGEILFFEPMDQHHDPIAPFSPIGISMPSTMEKSRALQAKKECERFLKLMNMQFGLFNIEYIYDKSGRLFILEVAPRAGGNLIPDVILHSAGADMRKELLFLSQNGGVRNPLISGITGTMFLLLLYIQRRMASSIQFGLILYLRGTLLSATYL